MNYRGTIAYRTNLGGMIDEGFLHSVVLAWDFLMWQSNHENTDRIEDPYRYHFMRGLSCMPDESANQIAETFLGDWVLMLDTDHIFAADSFLEMVTAFDENKLDVLVGFTQKRVAPYHPVLYKTKFEALVDFETIFPNPIERQTLMPIDSSGAACLMVRRRVFEKIQKMGERPFERRRKFTMRDFVPKDRWKDETFGEDTSFFWRCQMLGFQAYCAPWIKFHHLEKRLVTESIMQRLPAPEIPR